MLGFLNKKDEVETIATVADEAVADEAVADEAVADEAVADEAVADEAVADEAVADEEFADYLITGQGAEILNADGQFVRVCPIGTIQTLDVKTGDRFVDIQIAERVQ